MERNNKLDILRVIACIFVIIIHASGDYVNQYIGTNNSYFIVANIFDSFARSAVPIFVMMSGYLLLNNNNNIDLIFFYKKSFKKIGIPAITWSFIYFIFYEILLIAKGINYSNLLNPLYNWVKGVPAPHMWYMYMLLGIYLVTPFLVRLKIKNENKLYIYGMVFLLLGMLLYKHEFIWIIQFIQYLGYFILGYCIGNTQKNRNSLLYFGGWFISSLIICIGTYYLGNTSLYSNLSIPVVLASICIFKGILTLDVNISISSISKHTFNIYLIHYLIMTIISKIIGTLNLDKYPFIFITLATVIVFIISFIASKCIFYLKNKNRLIKTLL